MTRLLLLALLCASVFAETPVYRFLIVVDTSQSMNSRKSAAVKAVREVVASGVQEQIAPGDSIALWTFTSELHPDTVPPQTWSVERAKFLTELPARALGAEKFQGRTIFANIAEQVNRWIEGQADALLFLVTDGEDPIIGVPFAFELNEAIAPQRKKLRAAKKVFVASILVEKGRAREWRLFSDEGRLEVPKLPFREPEKAVVVETPTQVAAPEPVPEPPKAIELPPGARVAAEPVILAPAQTPRPQPATPVSEPKPEGERKPPPIEPAHAEIAFAEPRRVEVPPEVKPSVTNNEEAETSVPGATVSRTNQPPNEEAKVEAPSEKAAAELSTVAPAARNPVYFAVGGGLAVLVLAAMLLRPRKREDASLISKSMNR